MHANLAAALVILLGINSLIGWVEAGESKPSVVRPLVVKDPGGPPKMTVVASEAEMVEAWGKAIAAQIAGQVNFEKEKVVRMDCSSSGPPFDSIEHAVRGGDTVAHIYIKVPDAKIRGRAFKRSTVFFAVPAKATLRFDAPPDEKNAKPDARKAGLLELYEKIKPGMMRKDVEMILGKPIRSVTVRGGEEVRACYYLGDEYRERDLLPQESPFMPNGICVTFAGDRAVDKVHNHQWLKQIAWGKTVDGVEYGVAFKDHKRLFKVGEDVTFIISARNRTDAPVAFDQVEISGVNSSARSTGGAAIPQITDAQGKRVKAFAVFLPGPSPPAKVHKVTLDAKETKTLGQVTYSIGSGFNMPRIDTDAGFYRVRFDTVCWLPGHQRPTGTMEMVVLPTWQDKLSNDGMKELAENAVRANKEARSMTDPASTNPHLGGRVSMANPFKENLFWCVALKPNRAFTPRDFLAVSRSGTVSYPLKNDYILKILASEDTSAWKDKEFLEAAILVVHMQTFANEDGWKIVKMPAEFLAIEFNMNLTTLEKRQAAAKQIAAPEVKRRDGATTIAFFSWHLIGGELRRWEVVVGPKASISHKSLGSFGGGGYD